MCEWSLCYRQTNEYDSLLSIATLETLVGLYTVCVEREFQLSYFDDDVIELLKILCF